VNTGKGLDYIYPLTKDKDGLVRMFSVISLGLSLLGSGSSEIVEALMTKSEDRYVRRGGATALGLIFSGTKTGVERIRALTRDKDPLFRFAAGFSLNLPSATPPGSLTGLSFLYSSYGRQYGWWFSWFQSLALLSAGTHWLLSEGSHKLPIQRGFKF